MAAAYAAAATVSGGMSPYSAMMLPPTLIMPGMCFQCFHHWHVAPLCLDAAAFQPCARSWFWSCLLLNAVSYL